MEEATGFKHARLASALMAGCVLLANGETVSPPSAVHRLLLSTVKNPEYVCTEQHADNHEFHRTALKNKQPRGVKTPRGGHPSL
ncbi:hypothetical protein EYF80_013992 [Liparis tanakae]|uniref:Secreted protein n=1 Tax=Liparis tanakae TaxID=230148 RepID=A0A4Z2IE73_9TELE|nr:hypothetical protein EYF80_013992 [Liparis tanakae]